MKKKTFEEILFLMKLETVSPERYQNWSSSQIFFKSFDNRLNFMFSRTDVLTDTQFFEHIRWLRLSMHMPINVLVTLLGIG